MITAIFGFFSTLCAWLIAHFPQSPCASITISDPGGFATYSIQDILGWVNWLIPFGPMLILFNVWAGALLTASAVMFVVRKVVSMGTNGTLGNS